MTEGASSSALAVDEGGCLVDLKNTLFTENSANLDGGGMYFATPSCGVTLTGVNVRNNTAEGYGGGIAVSNLRGQRITVTFGVEICEKQTDTTLWYYLSRETGPSSKTDFIN